ncbi:MAG: heparinase II/III family protein [Pseudomonadota bacterium]
MTRRVNLAEALRVRAAGTATAALKNLRPVKPGSGRAPDLVSLSIRRPYGAQTEGAAILSGRWVYGGQTLDVGAHGHPFSVTLPSERFAAWLHGFGWLGDLLSVPDGPVKAGELCRQWVSAFSGANSFVHAPGLLAERMFNWGRLLSDLPDGDGTLAASYSAQMRVLRRLLPQLPPGLPVLRGQAAMVIYGARHTDRPETYLAKGLDALDEQINAQILADGGHVSRAPYASVDALACLLGTDAVLQAAGLDGSRALDRAIDRLIPMIATLRHTDGAMAVFHGGHEGDPARIDALMRGRDGSVATPIQPFAYGPNSGYHRLEAGSNVVIVDAQSVPPRPHDLDAHLAPLAMEISTSEGRLLVNCGWHPGAAPAWRRPVRSSDAHSSLTLAGRSPGEILETGFVADALGPAIAVASRDVRARRKEQSTGIWLEATHDGYKDAHGLVHRRRLFVGEDGDDIRGEDSLFVPAGDTPLTREAIPFTLRFHFHPDVRVSLAQDLSSALLVQKGRAGWRFRTDGGPLAVEPSVYLAGSARPVRAQQLVITGQALGDGDGQGRDNRVRWSFRRLKGRAA